MLVVVVVTGDVTGEVASVGAGRCVRRAVDGRSFEGRRGIE